MKRILCWIFLLTLMALMVACTDKPLKTSVDDDSIIRVKGSDTMVVLVKNLSEQYMTKSTTKIAVTGGGSGIGINALLSGTTDIANSSRSIKESERAEAASKGLDIKEHIVGLDGVSIIVNLQNPINALTMQQLSDIYQGEIINWAQLGGVNQEIILLSRESNSGTHVYFKENILHDKEFAENIEFLPNTKVIQQRVASTPGAIGYIGLGYADTSVKTLQISKDGKNTYLPSKENVKSGAYPLSRPLYMYTDIGIGEETQKYIEYVVGTEGQRFVEENGFVPLD